MFKSIAAILITPILLALGIGGYNHHFKEKVDSNIESKDLIAGAFLVIKEEPPKRLPVEEKQNLSGKPEFYPARNWAFSNPEISAKSALLYDFDDEKILFQKNINEVTHIASLTKIITAMVILDNLKLDEKIKISQEAVSIEGDYGGLIVNEELSVNQLLDLMLIVSSNDAAFAAAEHLGEKVIGQDKMPIEKLKVFIDLMNEKVIQIGAKNTRFFTPYGLDGNYSTAADLLQIIKYSLNYPLIWEIASIKEKIIYSVDRRHHHYLRNSNQLLHYLPNIIAGKTGYTEEAGECLIIIFKNLSDKKIVSIVLNSKDRDRDAEELIKWLEKAYYW